MTDRAEILIARAGAAGLGAARRLDEAAHADWRLYKVEAAAGGPAGGVVSVHAAPQVTRALSPMRRGFPAVPAGRASLP